MTTHYRWNDQTKVLEVMCRESGTPIFEHKFDNFSDAKDCADSFAELYDQGVRHGKRLAVEEMQRTVDHIDRNI
jgi:hypothetical protein